MNNKILQAVVEIAGNISPTLQKAVEGTCEKLDKVNIKSKAIGPTYLLIDGYNIIHAWDELKKEFDDWVAFEKDNFLRIHIIYLFL